MLQNTYSTAILRPVSNRAADAGTGYDIEFTGKDNDRAERAVGFEPTTNALEGRHSTAELCPQESTVLVCYYAKGGFSLTVSGVPLHLPYHTCSPQLCGDDPLQS